MLYFSHPRSGPALETEVAARMTYAGCFSDVQSMQGEGKTSSIKYSRNPTHETSKDFLITLIVPERGCYSRMVIAPDLHLTYLLLLSVAHPRIGNNPGSTSSPRRGEALYQVEVWVLASVGPLPRMLGNIIDLRSLRVTLVVSECFVNNNI